MKKEGQTLRTIPKRLMPDFQKRDPLTEPPPPHIEYKDTYPPNLAKIGRRSNGCPKGLDRSPTMRASNAGKLVVETNGIGEMSAQDSARPLDQVHLTHPQTTSELQTLDKIEHRSNRIKEETEDGTDEELEGITPPGDLLSPSVGKHTQPR